jgi:hypothetical protein
LEIQKPWSKILKARSHFGTPDVDRIIILRRMGNCDED